MELDIDEDILIEVVRDEDDFESTEVLIPDDLDVNSFDEETLKLLDSTPVILLEIPPGPAEAENDNETASSTPVTSIEGSNSARPRNALVKLILNCPPSYTIISTNNRMVQFILRRQTR